MATSVRSGRTPARSPWVDPLPDALGRDALSATESPTTLAYAITDIPDEQRRDVVQLDLEAGSSLLAAGAPRSGRTGLLASLALGAAGALSPDDLHLYVIDASGALVAVLGELPHCATLLGPNDLSVAPALLRRLAMSAATRTSAVPTSGAASNPVSLLLIDGWDSLTAQLADADALDCLDALGALQRSEQGAALTIAVTGDRTLLAPRFAGGFTERLLLRPIDRNDLGLVGISLRDAPSAMPAGRIVRAADGRVAQIVHPGDDPSLAAAQTAAAKLAAGWLVPSARHRAPARGRCPVRLRPLPDSVRLDDLPPAAGRIVLGQGGEASEAVAVDLFAGAARLLVAGAPRSGRSTVLRSMVRQLSGTDVRVVIAAGSRSPLRAVAQQHVGVQLVEPGGDASLLSSIPTTPTVLLVDDCEQFLDDPVADALTDWARSSAERLAVVAAGRADDLATSYRGVGAQVRRNNCGLLLRPGPVDGELLGVRLPRRPSSGPPGRGVLVGDPAWGSMFLGGAPVPIQIASP